MNNFLLDFIIDHPVVSLFLALAAVEILLLPRTLYIAYMLKKRSHELSKKYSLDPQSTYLIAGYRKSSSLRLVSFTKEGLRDIIQTNVTAPRLSAIKRDKILPYSDIERVIETPFITFSVVLRDENKRAIKNPFDVSINLDMHVTRNLTDLSYFNSGFFNGSTYRKIKISFSKAGVKVAARSSAKQRKRNIIAITATIAISILIGYIILA